MRELVGVVLDETLGAAVAAGLLVGGEAQRDRALGTAPARVRARTTDSTIALKSFMSIAPRPQTKPSRISPEKG